jgi:hypothetical protein
MKPTRMKPPLLTRMSTRKSTKHHEKQPLRVIPACTTPLSPSTHYLTNDQKLHLTLLILLRNADSAKCFIDTTHTHDCPSPASSHSGQSSVDSVDKVISHYFSTLGYPCPSRLIAAMFPSASPSVTPPSSAQPSPTFSSLSVSGDIPTPDFTRIVALEDKESHSTMTFEVKATQLISPKFD